MMASLTTNLIFTFQVLSTVLQNMLPRTDQHSKKGSNESIVISLNLVFFSPPTLSMLITSTKLMRSELKFSVRMNPKFPKNRNSNKRNLLNQLGLKRMRAIPKQSQTLTMRHRGMSQIEKSSEIHKKSLINQQLRILTAIEEMKMSRTQMVVPEFGSS